MSNADTMPVRPEHGMTRREELGASQIERTAETAVSAAAAQAEAQVKTMYSMALMRPRDWMVVREKLLAECKRPGLAANCRWKLPWLKDPKTGKPLEGPNIRLAEAVFRSTPNLIAKTTITYEDDKRRMGEVFVIDLETNNSYFEGFSIEKSREVSRLKGGEEVLGERTNSNGNKVFKIVAEEAQVLQKQNSQISRHLRNMIFRILPGDVLDEALRQCDRTMADADRKDPAATAKWICDAGASLGISVSQLREYLGHAADQVTPDEARDLRAIFVTIKEGETTWTEVMEAKTADQSESAPPDPAETAESGKLVSEISKGRLRDSKAWEAARKAAGVKGGIKDSDLPIETLRKIAEHMRPAPAGSSPAGKDAEKEAMGQELDEATRNWQQAAGPAPDPADVDLGGGDAGEGE